MLDAVLNLLVIMFLPSVVVTLFLIIAIVIDEIRYDIYRRYVEEREFEAELKEMKGEKL